jgi:hypothetical protein
LSALCFPKRCLRIPTASLFDPPPLNIVESVPLLCAEMLLPLESLEDLPTTLEPEPG